MHGVSYAEACAELTDYEEKYSGKAPGASDNQSHPGAESGTIRRIS